MKYMMKKVNNLYLLFCYYKVLYPFNSYRFLNILFTEIPDVTAKDSDKLGERFTEIFIKKQENVALILDYLEEFDFQVRWPALQLLLLLLTNK